MTKKFQSLIFISLLITGNLFLFQHCSQKKEILPEKINDLMLIKTIEGDEAKKYIDKLHFQPVSKNENIIGYYENLSGEAIVYVTTYPDQKEAKIDFEKMTEKISPENSVFVYPQFFDYKGNKIYKCFGMGMSHFVFSLNKNLYWISVDTHLAKDFFEEFYRRIR